MKKLIIIAAFALSLSGCLAWGVRYHDNDRRDNQRQERHDDRRDNGPGNDRRSR